MNKKNLIFILLFFISFVSSQDFKNTQSATKYHDYISNFDIVNTLVTQDSSSSDRILLCVGETYDINKYVTESITYKNIDIKTMCNNNPGTSPEQVKNCIGYKIAEKNLKSGEVKIISETRLNEFVNTEGAYKGHYDYSATDSKIENLLLQYNTALLSKFNPMGGTDVNTDGRTGVGCIGTYNYQIKQGSTTKLQNNGNLADKPKTINYMFSKGNYEIVYSSTINNCVSFYEERYEPNDYLNKMMHPFIRQVKSTPKTTTKTLYLKVVDGTTPSFSQNEGNINCGVIGTQIGIGGGYIVTPLIQGMSVIIPVSIKIENTFDVPINITKMNGYFYGSTFAMSPTGDITVNDITTNPYIGPPYIYSKYIIQPGQTKTVKVYVNATLKADVENPLDQYYLKVNFNYEYPTPEHGCYNGGTGLGYCPTFINVDASTENGDNNKNLNANVNFKENIIDNDFIKSEEEVNIYGKVTMNNGLINWGVGGANVKLTSLKIKNKNIDCLKNKNLNTKTSELGISSQPGYYNFDNVKLLNTCLNYLKNNEVNDNLIATIEVTHTIDGKPISGIFSGEIPININPYNINNYILDADVNFNEEIIDNEFIEDGKNKVNIFGKVNLTNIIEGKTERLGDADVELVSLQLNSKTDCLVNKGLKTKTRDDTTLYLKGWYSFNNVVLKPECLNYDINDELVAGIKVSYTLNLPGGITLPLSDTFEGEIPVNTGLPPLGCSIKYKMVGSSYNPGEGTETYNVTVEIQNGKDLNEIKYWCSSDDEEKVSKLNKNDDTFEFECEYEFESGNQEEIFIVEAEVSDNIGDRKAICKVDIGLCYPYI